MKLMVILLAILISASASAADLGEMRLQHIATTYECPNKTTATCFSAGGMNWAVDNGRKYIPGTQFLVMFVFQSLDDKNIQISGGKKFDDFFQVINVIIMED